MATIIDLVLREAFRIKATNGVTFREELTGHYSGQSNLTLFAEIDGKTVGTLEYAIFNGDPSISMVEVQPAYQRKGIGKAMVLHLQKQHPHKEIEWGMTTTDGTALQNSLRGQLYVDTKKIQLKKRHDDLVVERDKLQKEMDDLYKKFDTAPDEIRGKIQKLNDRWVAADDEIYELEKDI